MIQIVLFAMSGWLWLRLLRRESALRQPLVVEVPAAETAGTETRSQPAR